MSMEEKKMNSAMRLFEALSGVDQELLEKCEAESKGTKMGGLLYGKMRFNRKLRYGGATLAAAVCMLAVGLVVWQANGPTFTAKDEACEEAAPAAAAQDIAAGMQNTTAMLDAAVPEAKGYGVDGDKKEYAYSTTEESNAGVESGSVTGTANGNGWVSDSYSGSGQNPVTESESVKQETAEQYKEERLPEVEDLQQSMKDKELPEVSIDSAIGKDTRKNITEAQARELAVLGAYVPTALPAGYVWESGLLSAATETESERVFLTWTKGMDSIQLAISKVDAADVQLTDMAAEETYNVHLYDIPYAQTLPKEYRDTFNDPVFGVKDLSLELIEKRMKSFADAGDTDTPRGNFSVLYEDGVLVSFGGRGTAQEIWEMFVSME